MAAAADDFVSRKRQEAEAREEALRQALQEQLARSTSQEHALPIERLMDRLSAGEKLKDEEYAAISEEIKRIQARNADHLTRLEDLLDAKVSAANP